MNSTAKIDQVIMGFWKENLWELYHAKVTCKLTIETTKSDKIFKEKKCST